MGGAMRRIVTLGLGFALIIAACGGDDSAETTTTTAGVTTTVATTTTEATTTTTAATTTTTTEAETTTTTSAPTAPSTLWVTDQTAGSLHKVDPATGEMIFVTDLPSPANGVALGAGSAWVALSSPANSLARVDGESGEILALIEIGSGTGGVTFSEGFAWVSSFEAGTVSQVDPATNEVVATIDVGAGATGMTSGSAWVTTWTAKTLNRIEADGSLESIDLPSEGSAPAVSTDGSYIAATLFNEGQVILFDATFEVGDLIDTGQNANVIAYGFDAFWATNSVSGEVWRIDPATKTGAAATVVPGALGVVAGDDMVYVASFGTGTVYQFPPGDPSAMTDVYNTGGSAYEVAYGSAG